MADPPQLYNEIATAGGHLWTQISKLASEWLAPVLTKLESQPCSTCFPKAFNDPVWGTIELYPWEVLLLDSPLLQRLRGVRQLGLAHYVYPGATHDRLEHSRGVVEAAERMIRALTRNAKHRHHFGHDADDTIVVPDEDSLDIRSIRLAALLHDIGHGPFSHATEQFLRDQHADSLERLEEVLRAHFEGVLQIASAEVIAVLFVLSDAMRAILEHPHFEAVQHPSRLAPAIAARILGSRSYLHATYLSGIISGPLDADKLDYMARDSHHAGLPIAVDLHRLISKLEVVSVTIDNAPNENLQRRARCANHARFHELGISAAGLAAYEQSVVSRVFLYDRIYFHHKVRAAEGMLRRLYELVQDSPETPLAFSEILTSTPDDGAVLGICNHASIQCADDRVRQRIQTLGRSIQLRDLYVRSYAFSSRFISGLEGLSAVSRADTLALIWNRIIRELSEPEGRTNVAQSIHQKGRDLISAVPDARLVAEDFYPEHVLVDLPTSGSVARGGDILTRTQSGHIATPNLFFDPERWLQAYEKQKLSGYVFAPRRYQSLVHTASRIVFFERYGVVMSPAADEQSKIRECGQFQWIEQAARRGICSQEAYEALRGRSTRLIAFTAGDIRAPDEWRDDDPGFVERLLDEFEEALPTGLPGPIHTSVCEAIEHLIAFLDMTEKTGTFVKVASLREKELQTKLREFLIARGIAATEGAEIGGGETDLILPGSIVVENKVAARVADPLAHGPNYGYQGRRYSIAVCRRVTFVLLAFRPADESQILPLSKRIRIQAISGVPEPHAQVRFAIPWGHSVPSRAKAPRA